TTLIDTGCNTSIIHSDLLHTLRDEDGNHFNVVEMKEPQSLLSASGGIVKVNRSASLTFHVDGPSITLSTSWILCQCHRRFCWAWTSSLNMGSALMHQTTLYASRHQRAMQRWTTFHFWRWNY